MKNHQSSQMHKWQSVGSKRKWNKIVNKNHEGENIKPTNRYAYLSTIDPNQSHKTNNLNHIKANVQKKDPKPPPIYINEV